MLHTLILCILLLTIAMFGCAVNTEDVIGSMPVKLRMRANWNRVSLLAQMCEAVRALPLSQDRNKASLSSNSFLNDPFFDCENIAAAESARFLHSNQTYSDNVEYVIAKHIAKVIVNRIFLKNNSGRQVVELSSEIQSCYDTVMLTLHSQRYSGLVSAHAQIFNEYDRIMHHKKNTDSDCFPALKVHSIIDSGYVCGTNAIINTIKKMYNMMVTGDIIHTLDDKWILPGDHRYNTINDDYANGSHGIIYGVIGSRETHSILAFLKEIRQKNMRSEKALHGLAFVYRHHPKSVCSSNDSEKCALFVQGFGVTLDIKNSDYITANLENITKRNTKVQNKPDDTPLDNQNLFVVTPSQNLNIGLKRFQSICDKYFMDCNDTFTEELLQKVVRKRSTTISSVRATDPDGEIQTAPKDLLNGAFFDLYNLGAQLVFCFKQSLDQKSHNQNSINRTLQELIDYSHNYPAKLKELTSIKAFSFTDMSSSSNIGSSILKAIMFLRNKLGVPNGYNELFIRGPGAIGSSVRERHSEFVQDNVYGSSYVGSLIANERYANSKMNTPSTIKNKNQLFEFITSRGSTNLAGFSPYFQTVHHILDILGNNEYIQYQLASALRITYGQKETQISSTKLQQFTLALERCLSSTKLMLQKGSNGQSYAPTEQLQGDNSASSEMADGNSDMRYNIDQSHIVWINNIEADDSYNSFNPSFNYLNSREAMFHRMQNALVFLKKNIYNLVCIIDISGFFKEADKDQKSKNNQIIEILLEIYGKKVPVRLGFVFVNSALKNSISGSAQISSDINALIHAALFQVSNRMERFSLALENDNITIHRKNSADTILEDLKTVMTECLWIINKETMILVDNEQINNIDSVVSTLNKIVLQSNKRIDNAINSLGGILDQITMDILLEEEIPQSVEDIINDPLFIKTSVAVNHAIFDHLGLKNKDQSPLLLLNGVSILNSDVHYNGEDMVFRSIISAIAKEEQKIYNWYTAGNPNNPHHLGDNTVHIYDWIMRKTKAFSHYNDKMAYLTRLGVDPGINTYVNMPDELDRLLVGHIDNVEMNNGRGGQKNLMTKLRSSPLTAPPSSSNTSPQLVIMTQVLVINGEKCGLKIKKTMMPTHSEPVRHFAIKVRLSKELEMLHTLAGYYAQCGKNTYGNNNSSPSPSLLCLKCSLVVNIEHKGKLAHGQKGATEKGDTINAYPELAILIESLLSPSFKLRGSGHQHNRRDAIDEEEISAIKLAALHVITSTLTSIAERFSRKLNSYQFTTNAEAANVVLRLLAEVQEEGDDASKEYQHPHLVYDDRKNSIEVTRAYLLNILAKKMGHIINVKALDSYCTQISEQKRIGRRSEPYYNIRKSIYKSIKDLSNALTALSDTVDMSTTSQPRSQNAWYKFSGPLLITNGRVISFDENDRFTNNDNELLLRLESKLSKNIYTCLTAFSTVKENDDEEGVSSDSFSVKIQNNDVIPLNSLYDNHYVDIYSLYSTLPDATNSSPLSSSSSSLLLDTNDLTSEFVAGRVFALASVLQAMDTHVISPTLRKLNDYGFNKNNLKGGVSDLFFRDIEDNGILGKEFQEEEKKMTNDCHNNNVNDSNNNNDKKTENNTREGSQEKCSSPSSVTNIVAKNIKRTLKKILRRNKINSSSKVLSSSSLPHIRALIQSVTNVVHRATRSSLRDVHQSLVIHICKHNGKVQSMATEDISNIIKEKKEWSSETTLSASGGNSRSTQYVRAIVDPTSREGQRILSLVKVMFDSLSSITITILINPVTITDSEGGEFAGGPSLGSLVRRNQRMIFDLVLKELFSSISGSAPPSPTIKKLNGGNKISKEDNDISDRKKNNSLKYLNALLSSRSQILDVLNTRDINDASSSFSELHKKNIALQSSSNSISINPNAHGKMPLSFYRYVFDNEFKFAVESHGDIHGGKFTKQDSGNSAKSTPLRNLHQNNEEETQKMPSMILVPPSAVFNRLPSKIITEGLIDVNSEEEKSSKSRTITYTLGTDEPAAWMVFLDDIKYAFAEKKEWRNGIKMRVKNINNNSHYYNHVVIDADNLRLDNNNQGNNLKEKHQYSTKYSYIDVEYGLHHILLTGKAVWVNRTTRDINSPPQSLPLVLLPPLTFDSKQTSQNNISLNANKHEKFIYKPYSDTMVMAHNFGYFQLKIPSRFTGFGLYKLDIHLNIKDYYEKYSVLAARAIGHGSVYLPVDASNFDAVFFQQKGAATEDVSSSSLSAKEVNSTKINYHNGLDSARNLVMVTSFNGQFVELYISEPPVLEMNDNKYINNKNNDENNKEKQRTNNTRPSLHSHKAHVSALRRQFTSEDERQATRNSTKMSPTLNVFSLASGILYERLLRLMMYGVTVSSNSTSVYEERFYSQNYGNNNHEDYYTVETLVNNDEVTFTDFLEADLGLDQNKAYDLGQERVDDDSNTKVFSSSFYFKRANSHNSGESSNGRLSYQGLPIGFKKTQKEITKYHDVANFTESALITSPQELLRQVRVSHQLTKQLVSIPKNKKIKFWLIENFLSPDFKKKIGPFAKNILNADVELISYKWPYFLRKQADKQRFIWAYKVLFLDVLFPLDVDRVIFVDSDQIVSSEKVFELTGEGQSFSSSSPPTTEEHSVLPSPLLATAATYAIDVDVGQTGTMALKGKDLKFAYKPFTDLHELYNLDIDGKAIAFTPFCGSRHTYYSNFFENSNDNANIQKEQIIKKQSSSFSSNLPDWQKRQQTYDLIGNISQEFSTLSGLFSDYLDAYDISQQNNINEQTKQFCFWNTRDGSWIRQLQENPIQFYKKTRFGMLIDIIIRQLENVKTKNNFGKKLIGLDDSNNDRVFKIDKGIVAEGYNKMLNKVAGGEKNMYPTEMHTDNKKNVVKTVLNLFGKNSKVDISVLRRLLREMRRLERKVAIQSNRNLMTNQSNWGSDCKRSSCVTDREVQKFIKDFRAFTGFKKDYYHISALFLVDFPRFRYAYNGGDVYRFYYQQLSQDPHSLSNLDQDLPNFVQRISSTPQEFIREIQDPGIKKKQIEKLTSLLTRMFRLVDMGYVLNGKRNLKHGSYTYGGLNKCGAVTRKSSKVSDLASSLSLVSTKQPTIYLGDFVSVLDARKSSKNKECMKGKISSFSFHTSNSNNNPRSFSCSTNSNCSSHMEEQLDNDEQNVYKTDDDDSITSTNASIFDTISTGIPIYSLPETFLYCSTWCSKKMRPYIKTVDLCNNPLTKVTKTENANSVINQWDKFDKVVRELWEGLEE